MKLSELPPGSAFALNRTGDKYTKLGKHYWNGRPTSRFNVKPHKPHWMDNHEHLEPSLNHQCEVTPLPVIN